ncbi:MAG: 3',5'-nucleoside bisphosphate phosphatase [Pseudomonadota bacterium]
MLDYDLHCHSTVSDGLLLPTELIARAAGRGVKFLALTDHDDVTGLPEAAAAALQHGLQLINGVEVSVSWRSHTLHVVGLNINPAYAPLVEGLRSIRSGRAARAQMMADSLARSGISGALEGAYRFAGNPGMIGRTHFARFLVESGHCKDVRSVFKNYLVKGKPGYAPHEWAALPDVIGWIVGSGGVAVLAHPGRYTAGPKGMGQKTLRELLREFADAGGRAIEVVSGSHTVEQYVEFARYAKEFGFFASCGSDFHGPGESYRDLGRLPDFPLDCRPVWQVWEANQVTA